MNLQFVKFAEDKKEKEEITQLLAGSTKILGILNRLIEEQIESTDKQILSWKRYFMPRWSEYQADQIGYKRALRYVQTIIKEK
jgi:hypothetical protein